MRLLVYVIFAASFMFGQIVAASPREDAEYIAESMISENDHAIVFKILSGAYVTYFAKELREHSVTVVDADRFAEMLPVKEFEPWVVRWRELYVDRLLEVYTPAQLVQIKNAQIANIGSAREEKPDTLQAADGNEIGLLMGVTAHFITIQFLVQPEIKQSMPKLNEAPYLVDILEIDGIFIFPNRIWRKDLIAKIRSGY